MEKRCFMTQTCHTGIIAAAKKNTSFNRSSESNIISNYHPRFFQSFWRSVRNRWAHCSDRSSAVGTSWGWEISNAAAFSPRNPRIFLTVFSYSFTKSLYTMVSGTMFPSEKNSWSSVCVAWSWSSTRWGLRINHSLGRVSKIDPGPSFWGAERRRISTFA